MIFDTLLSRTWLRKHMDEVNSLETGLPIQVRLPGLP